jgi:SAM-dependent methyltransferase
MSHVDAASLGVHRDIDSLNADYVTGTDTSGRTCAPSPHAKNGRPPSVARFVNGLLARVVRARLKLARARRRFGLPGVTMVALALLRQAASSAHRAAARSLDPLWDRIIDGWLGVDSRRRHDLGPAVKELALGGDPVRYEPISLLWWVSLMSALPLEPAGSTFVDLGSGQGRALLLAAKMGFSRIVGVELDARLVAGAERNIAHWSRHPRNAVRRGAELQVVHADAATYRLPDGPLCVFLFNPFGSETLRHVLRNLGSQPSARTAHVFVAYFNPLHEHVFREFEYLALESRGKNWVLYRAGAAAAQPA